MLACPFAWVSGHPPDRLPGCLRACARAERGAKGTVVGGHTHTRTHTPTPIRTSSHPHRATLDPRTLARTPPQRSAPPRRDQRRQRKHALTGTASGLSLSTLGWRPPKQSLLVSTQQCVPQRGETESPSDARPWHSHQRNSLHRDTTAPHTAPETQESVTPEVRAPPWGGQGRQRSSECRWCPW